MWIVNAKKNTYLEDCFILTFTLWIFHKNKKHKNIVPCMIILLFPYKTRDFCSTNPTLYLRLPPQSPTTPTPATPLAFGSTPAACAASAATCPAWIAASSGVRRRMGAAVAAAAAAALGGVENLTFLGRTEERRRI